MADNDTKNKRSRGIGPYLVLFALVIIVGVFWYQKRQENREKDELIQLPVKVMQPVYGELKKVFSVSGYIESDATVRVHPKISGTLVFLHVDVGDLVEENEVIGEIEEERYRLSLNEAEAAFAAAESTFNRTENLYRAKAVSKQNYDEAKARYDMTMAQLKQARLQYRYTRVRAPLSGTVLMRHVSQGALISPEVPIVTVADTEDLLVKADIPEDYYGFFAVHSKEIEAFGEVPALGTSNTGNAEQPSTGNGIPFTVSIVAPFISAETKSFHVHCKPVERVEEMRPGMFLTISFTLEKQKDIFTLPHECLVAGNTLWIVEDGRAKRIEYTPGFSAEEGFTVPEAFKGHTFIYEGQHFLEDNQKVKVVK